MVVWAYSGIANPLREYRAGGDNVSTSTNSTLTYTLSITHNGVIQSFLSLVNQRLMNQAVGSITGLVTVSVQRNGQIIAVNTINESAFNTNFGAGYLFYETLNFLAGSEVFAGETFTLNVAFTGFTGTWNLDHDDKITLLVASKESSFSV